MASQTPFKDYVNPEAIRGLAGILAAGDPRIDVDRFCAEACEGLEDRELKERVAHVARVVAAHVDPDFPTAAVRLVTGLPPAQTGTEDVVLGFTIWPLCTWVEHAGIDHFDAAMAAMHALTQRFSCEFAVRPYLARQPERTLAVLADWTRDPSVHVRRLVSEGTRPRLPWGERLHRFTADPTETLALLERLKDDPERYVQRSVANHLNDISKDHPDRAVAVAASWLEDPTPDRQWIVKHALRGLVKAGHAGALAVLGYGPPALEVAHFTVPAAFTLGGKLALATELVSTSDQDQPLIVDVVVHLVKASGRQSPKVFKWTSRTLRAGQRLKLEKGLPLKPVSTRRFYPGTHAVTLQINGHALGTRDFQLSLPPE